jgi:hypothetical protein
MKPRQVTIATNRRLARRLWVNISPQLVRLLSELTAEYNLSIARGELVLLGARWYVTHTGLLSLARRNRCASILAKPVQAFCDPTAQPWAFEATVYKSKTCGGFVGFGDADPSNVSPLVRGAEMRVAETRAVNRALRKAYGIGICSAEEIGSFPRTFASASETKKLPPQSKNESGDGRPRIRDRLCQLIRQHSLDPDLVKSYAIDFCGTQTLKEATRAQVENFVDHLADWAEKDRNALLCQLNSYLPRGENKEGAA